MSKPVYVPRSAAVFKFGQDSFDYVMGKLQLSQIHLFAVVQTMLNGAVNETVKDVQIWMRDFIPVRSKDLQNSLIDFLKKSIAPPSVIGRLIPVRVVIGAAKEIHYIQYLEKMTEKNVQHFGSFREHSGRKAYSKGAPVFLDDPTAKAPFFNEMKQYAIERLYVNLAKQSHVFNDGNQMSFEVTR